MPGRKKLFNYTGAKTAVVDKIISYFPDDYQKMCWLEAFGGTGILTYYKDESAVEVFNDLDQGISAIFFCLLFKYEELMWKLSQYDQHSEHILNWVTEGRHLSVHPDELVKMRIDDLVSCAIGKLYQVQYSFGAKQQSVSFWRNPEFFGTRKYSSMRLFDSNVWPRWKKRFENVQIMGRTANDVIKLFDSKDLFVYCDPPYTVTEKGKHYSLIFTEEDHKELAKTLHNIEGKFLLSYDDVPFIHELYPDNYKTTITFRYSLQKDNRKQATELLIANYPIKIQTKLDSFLA